MRIATFMLAFWVSFAAQAFTYDDLVSLIQKGKITRLEDLLPKLPPDFRSAFALVHTSHSRQEADADHPRVILFGMGAQLTCAFNGGEARIAGNDTLECFQFHKAEREFEFREIRFPNAENGLSAVKFSERGLSADGTSRCARCHGEDSRPNWEEYPKWPGTYAEDDGGWHPDEESHYGHFRGLAENHPRYRHLDVPSFRDYLSRHSNIRFGDFVGRMNAARLQRITESKLADGERVAFAVSGLECSLSEQTRDELAAIDPDYRNTIDPKRLFEKTGLSIHEWTLRLDGTPSTPFSRLPFDHQTGYGRQLVSLAMAEIGHLADAGDEPLKTVFHSLLQHRRPPSDEQRVASELLDAILPGIDFYDPEFGDAQAELCPPLIDRLRDAMRHKQESSNPRPG